MKNTTSKINLQVLNLSCVQRKAFGYKTGFGANQDAQIKYFAALCV